jgi:group I intron endonuclease
MDHHPTSFFILENTQLGTFWVGQAKMSHLPAVTRDGLVQKLETRYPEYGSPCLHLISINKNGTLPFYGVERWLSKLEYKLKQSPHRHEDLRNLLTAGWHSHDFTINSTLNVLHSIYKTDLKVLHRRLVDEWESRGLRCLNSTRFETRIERYQRQKKDPDFLKTIGRKKILRQMEKTGKLPKPETLAKHDIKEDELREIMGPKGIIYKITSPSGKVYVGQTVRSFEKRMQEHRQETSCCTSIKRAIDKYGDQMKYEIIEGNVPHEQLDEREIYWIKELNSLAPHGYNLTTGGQFSKEYSQELKDKMRDIKNTQKVEKDGYMGDVNQMGNLFYPRVRQNGIRIHVSYGGFQTEEEAIEVLKAYTKDPENFTVVNNRTRKKVGSVRKSHSKWSAGYKQIPLGTYDTEKEAHDAVEKYLKDPENFPSFKRNVGNISRSHNKWQLKYKHEHLGTYDTQEEAREALTEYLKDPENFVKPESKSYSITTHDDRWLLRCNGRIVSFYPTQEEAEEARQALQSS